MIILTRSSKGIFDPMRYTRNRLIKRENACQNTLQSDSES